MAYLEQSTRYIAYDARLGGRYRYYRDPAVLALAARHPLRRRHGPPVRHLRRAACRRCRTSSASQCPQAGRRLATSSTARPSGPRRSTRVRGILPAASLSNVGIYGTGQAYEPLLLRMRAHPLPEARTYADLMLHELRKVIPSVPQARRPRPIAAGRGATTWSRPATATADDASSGCSRRRASRGRAGGHPGRLGPRRRGQARWPRCCYAAHAPARAPDRRPGPARCRPTSGVARPAGLRGGADATAATSPGRAFERTDYRFDVLADYGAFRDLQRHRMLTIEWQPLTPRHGYTRPEARRRGRRRRGLRRRHGPLGRPLRRPRRAVPGAGPLRRLHGLPGPLRHAAQRPRGHAPARAAHRHRRATRPTGASPRTCTASSPSRPATGPSPPRCAT